MKTWLMSNTYVPIPEYLLFSAGFEYLRVLKKMFPTISAIYVHYIPML